MKKLLFVDHAFHQKTGSADFFVDVLRGGFSVESYYLSPNTSLDGAVLDAAGRADVIVLWQMDFLAPAFLALGKPVVVVPMFDGSGGMPDLHWLFAHKARFLNFSLVLNERIRMAGCDTMLLRYFPEPVREEQLPRFDALHGFFWQRRPDHGVHFDLVDRLIGHDLTSLHVHDAADIPGTFTPRPKADSKYGLTTSAWFRDKAGYARTLAKANVFIAPRVAEGIGMALLEAMAQGKVVLAHDAPTNNEYVSNWCNGVLFNKDHPEHTIDLRTEAPRLGRQAWLTVVEGRRHWLASHPGIIDWVDGAVPGPSIAIDHAAFLSGLWQSYYSSLDEYVGFLGSHLGLLAQLSDRSFTKLLDTLGEAREAASVSKKTGQTSGLGDDGVLDLTLDDDRFIGEGWSGAEAEWRWATGYRSEIDFSYLDATIGRISASFTASALPNLGKWVQTIITLNGHIVFDGRIKPEWSIYHFDFDASILDSENHIILSFDKAMTLPNDTRLLSICFKQFTFARGGLDHNGRSTFMGLFGQKT